MPNLQWFQCICNRSASSISAGVLSECLLILSIAWGAVCWCQPLLPSLFLFLTLFTISTIVDWHRLHWFECLLSCYHARLALVPPWSSMVYRDGPYRSVGLSWSQWLEAKVLKDRRSAKARYSKWSYVVPWRSDNDPCSILLTWPMKNRSQWQWSESARGSCTVLRN